MTDVKATVHRFYEIMDAGAVDRFDAIIAPDATMHAGAGSNRDEFKTNVVGFTAAFPDLVADVQHLVAEGDTVSAWIRYHGTHKGTFAGVTGTDRPVRFAAWDLFRVQDDRIVELTQFCDLFTILNQIGALPTAAPA